VHIAKVFLENPLAECAARALYEEVDQGIAIIIQPTHNSLGSCPQPLLHNPCGIAVE
jgi:hypothetical protein